MLAFFEGEGDEGLEAFVEPFVIMLILVINAIVGVWQEHNAENALDALKEMQTTTTRVLRNGKIVPDVPSSELVPGDVVDVRVGDKVPADVRIMKFKTTTFKTDEGSLTGESETVLKHLELVAKDARIQSKLNMMFSGTTVSNGAAIGVVTATGMRTEIGKIQANVTEAKEDEEKTPLGQKARPHPPPARPRTAHRALSSRRRCAACAAPRARLSRLRAAAAPRRRRSAAGAPPPPLPTPRPTSPRQIDAFGEQLARVIAGICVLVWVMNINQFSDPVHGGFWKGMIYYLKIAVALGVAAIPEGLPAVITLCLALGTRKMVKRNAVIRKLPSVETLGCCTVICSDKTGTLTTNQMTVVAMAYPGKAAGKLTEHEVSGTSYNPEGEVKGLPSPQPQGVLDLAKVCSLCNESVIRYVDGKYERMGEPTEAALKVLVEKIGVTEQPRSSDPALACSQANAQWAAQAPCQAILEFNRDRKSMSTLCGVTSADAAASATGTPGRQLRSGKTASAGGSGKNQLYCKGAPESVLERCAYARLADGSTVSMSAADRKAILAKVSEMAARPLRTLAMAVKEDVGELADYDGPSHPAHQKLADVSKFAAIEKDMVFVGLCGIKDPARPEVKPAIASCATAGIRVVMITGDTKPTAEAIAREIGIFGPKESIDGRSFTGAEFFDLPAAKRTELLTKQRSSMVFSRTEPRDKQELVKILRQAGEVPAMTGDGVNDAPALKQASIGVAMGIAGTEVAKEAADMVLADDNFATIVAAVEEGRSIYSNMKAFIRYLISSNIGEVAAIFITALLGLPEGLIPLQLLWVNLVTDGPPATALGFNPPDADIMKKPPRSADDELISPWIFFRYMIVGLYVGFATVGVFVYWYVGYDWSEYSHPLVTYGQLSNWGKCTHFSELGLDQNWPPAFGPWAANGGMDLSAKPCSYLSGAGKKPASTMSLSVLVAIEMFNALNAISEDGSLLSMPPWVNPWLLLAMAVSFGLHFVILYVPFLADIFSIVPLTVNDWIVVTAFSFPVVLIDECLKAVGRARLRKELAERMAKSKGD